MPLAIVTGAMLIVCGAAVAFKWKAQLAATGMGICSGAIVLLGYLPLLAGRVEAGRNIGLHQGGAV